MTGEHRPLDLPSGFRFHPTDEELVKDYLCRKCASQEITAPVMAEVDLYKFDPWQLPALAIYGEKEWFFFSPRDRKYPKGSRPNRSAGNGYWKATGADKPIGQPKTLAVKKALVFYAGKAPRGVKTNWIMHEYRLANVDRTAVGDFTNLRLDKWVLCRIYNKKGIIEKHYVDQNTLNDSEMEEQKPNISSVYNPMPPPLPPHQPKNLSALGNDFFNLETSDSMPRLLTDSSGSEHVASSDFTYEKEVQSEAKPTWSDWDQAFGFEINNMDEFSSQNDPFASQFQYQMDQNLPSHDMLFNFQKHL